MRVACATSTMSSFFRDVFPDLTIVDPKAKKLDNLDLLILTGGEDVNPKRYGEVATGSYGWSDHRDDIELSIYTSYINDTRTKVLGVCRGMQLMNVAKGGSLYQNIVPGHRHTHKITHTKEMNPFSYLVYVNSLHHQGIKRVGDDYYSILAVEPVSKISEIVLWRNRELGVQFHPELFYDGVEKNKFFDIIKDWVNGVITLDGSDIQKEHVSHKRSNLMDDLLTGTNTAGFTTGTAFTRFTADFGLPPVTDIFGAPQVAPLDDDPDSEDEDENEDENYDESEEE